MKAEFDQYAGDYDRLLEEALPSTASDEYFAAYKVDLLVQRAKHRSIAAVLDFGCGTGRSVPYLEKAFPDATIYGFDPSEECLKLAKSRSKALFESEIKLLPKGHFDIVLAANVFHHISTDERPAVLRTCASLLSDEGRIALFEHNPFNPLTRWVFERCAFDRGAQMLPMSEAKGLARDAGLTVTFGAYTLFVPPFLRRLRFVERALGRLPLGAQYYVEISK